MGMKCVQCGTDNLLSDRTQHSGRCKRCNHPFTFEPTAVTNKKLAFTDPFFKKAIEDISSQGILFFTPRQFLYFIDRRLKVRSSLGMWSWIPAYFFIALFVLVFGTLPLYALFSNLSLMLLIVASLYNLAWIRFFFTSSKSPQRSIRERRDSAINLQILGVIILVIGIPASLANNYAAGYLTATVLGLSAFWLGLWQKRRQQNMSELFLVSAEQSNEWLRRWQTANGSLEKLLPARPVALPASIDPEVTAYSFDRAIVCDSDAIAQFLIANNIHFENNCAILSISGYPQSLFSTVIEMLRRNADLKVYALHDASPTGVSLVHQLQSSSDWFANQTVTILNLGLSPRQILTSRDLFVQQSQALAQAARQIPDAVRQSLTAEEIAWLEAGNCVELGSFAPQRLLRVVNYGLAQSDPQSNDGLILVDDGARYGGGYVFVSDSFG